MASTAGYEPMISSWCYFVAGVGYVQVVWMPDGSVVAHLIPSICF